jgi:upstream activation factor subunit UAF30
MPRTEAVQKLWVYIKRHKLQDTKDPRIIHSNDVLKPLFGKRDAVDILDVAKLVGRQLTRTSRPN